jgi:phosphoesterase RecJ-like protein
MQTTSQEILAILKNSQKILLVTHKRPDGDAIGSLLAMYHILRFELGKEVQMAAEGPLPMVASVLSGGFKIADSFWPEGIDTVVLLDCGGWSRTGFFETDELNIDWPANLIVLDHHGIQTVTPGLHLINPQLSSTAELITNLLVDWGIEPTPEVATCLWAGLSSDTSSFKHVNTSEGTLLAAAILLSAGADIERVAMATVNALSAAGLHLWGRVLSGMRYDSAKGVLSSLVSQADLVDTGATPQDIEGLIGLMNKVPAIKVVMLATELPEGRWKVSLRTEDERVNVAQLAQKFGGGGHPRAAGFEITV